MDLFDWQPAAYYPASPGFKARDTSRAAAADIAPKAPTLRQQVLDVLKAGDATADEVAARLRKCEFAIRPRLSELSAAGLIEDTPARRPSSNGKMSIVWRAVRDA